MPAKRHLLWILIAALCASGAGFAVLEYWLQRTRSGVEHLPLNMAAWQSYEGSWALHDQEIVDRTGGRGDKLITGDPNLNDFTYRAELRFDSDRDFEFGDAGLVLRASNLAIGTDSLYGYYVGIRPGTQSLKFGRIQDEYFDLDVRSLSEPIHIGEWYELTVSARACKFSIDVRDAGKHLIGSLSFEDRGCPFRAGQVGIRSYGMLASWRNLSLQHEA